MQQVFIELYNYSPAWAKCSEVQLHQWVVLSERYSIWCCVRRLGKVSMFSQRQEAA